MIIHDVERKNKPLQHKIPQGLRIFNQGKRFKDCSHEYR